MSYNRPSHIQYHFLESLVAMGLKKILIKFGMVGDIYVKISLERDCSKYNGHWLAIQVRTEFGSWQTLRIKISGHDLYTSLNRIPIINWCMVGIDLRTYIKKTCAMLTRVASTTYHVATSGPCPSDCRIIYINEY